MEDLKISNLHVSTMVQISRVTTNINLSELANHLSINDNILYIEHASIINKGINPKNKPKKNKNPDKKNYFYNQVTIHIMCGKRINLKIFNNGRVQMTGIKNEKQGLETTKLLIEEFKSISEDHKISIFDSDEIKLDGEIETVLINSDFDIHFTIDREVLHRLVVELGYYSSYEPCTYPGVNIKYYHNPTYNNFGICECDKPCNGKGKDNTCKKITIAVFKSGKIIITGGRNKENVKVAYNFITDILNENKEQVKLK